MFRLISLACSLSAATASFAHEIEEMKVTRFFEEHGYISIILDNTSAGVPISCAIYDAEGNAIRAVTWITENLATEALVEDTGIPAASARCAPS